MKCGETTGATNEALAAIEAQSTAGAIANGASRYSSRDGGI